VGDLNTNISVDAGDAIGSVEALAGAFRELATAADSALETLGRPLDVGGIGAISDSMRTAAAAIDDSVSSMVASIGRLGGAADAAAGQLGALGDAGKGLADAAAGAGALDEELKGVAGAAGTARDAMAGAADAGKAVADANKGITETSPGVTDGFKEQSSAAADLAALQADLARSSKIVADAQADQAARSVATAATVARSQAIQEDAAASLGTTSIEQDAAIVQSTRMRQAATEDAAASAEASAGKYHMLTLGIAGAVGYGTYLDAQLQTAGTRWYTSAGESLKNVPGDEASLLAMSGPTATSQAQLEQGEYWTQSAGFHGRDAAAVLKPTAEAAYSEGASLQTTSNAMTTLLNDYFGGPQKSAATQGKMATEAANMLMSSVGLGKMTLEQAASALPVMLPAAKQAGLQLPQVLGVLSTMTAQGTNPQEAAQLIKHTMGAIQGPSSVQTAEMTALGINPVQFARDLGKQGLTGTIAEADSAIRSHTKNGMVELDVLNHSAQAMQSANAEITELPKNLQGSATEYLAGKLGTKQWYDLTAQSKSTLGSGAEDRMRQFQSVADLALGYSSLVKSGMGTQQTQAQALNKLFGGQEGQTVALQAGGRDHLGTFRSDVDTIGESARHAGANIRGWSSVQDSLNYKLKNFQYSLEAVATEAGQVVLPAVSKIMGGASDVLGFAAAHPAVTKDVMMGAGLLALPAILSKVAGPFETLAASAGKVGESLGIPGASKLGSLGKSTSAAGADAAAESVGRLAGAASTATGAIAELGGAASKAAGGEAAAGAAGSKEAYGEAAAGNAGKGEAAGETEAGAAGTKEAYGETAAGNAGKEEALGESEGGAGGGAGSFLGKGFMTLIAASMVDSWLKSQKNSQGNWLDNGMGTPSSSGWNNFGTLGHDIKTLWGLNPGAGSDAKPVAGVASRFWTPSAEPSTPKAAPKITPDVENAGAYSDDDLLKVGQKSAAEIPVKIKPVIDSTDIGQTVRHALGGLGGAQAGMAAVKIPAPDLSALDAARTKAAVAMAGVMTAMKGGASGASGIGASVDSGLAAGISGGEGIAVAAAHSVIAAVVAAMHTGLDAHSPSRVTEAIGEAEFDGGFEKGITAGIPRVKAAAEGLTKAAAASLVTGLQGGQSAITAARNLADGTTSPFSDSTIAGTITTFEDDVAKALKKGKIDKSEDSAMVAYLKADEAKLQALAKQRASLEQQITAAQNYAQGVQAAANQSASIMTVASNAQAAEAGNAPAAVAPPQFSDLVSGMQAQITSTKQFNADIAKLRKEGLDKAQLDQIIQSGAAAGDPVAQAILSGGKSGIEEMDKLASQMNAAAKQLGVTSGNAMYESASKIGGGLASGLKSQLGAVDKSISQLASSMTSALNAALGSGAGAAAFKDGQQLGKELAAGLASAEGAMTSAITDAISAAEKAAISDKKKKKGSDGSSAADYAGAAFDQHPAAAVPHPAAAVPSGGGSSGGGGGGTVTHQTTTNLTVDGNVLARVVQEHTLTRGLNNPTSGMVVPGKTG
jgi:hypothetical protein